jgi:hypothetical protein
MIYPTGFTRGQEMRENVFIGAQTHAYPYSFCPHFMYGMSEETRKEMKNFSESKMCVQHARVGPD